MTSLTRHAGQPGTARSATPEETSRPRRSRTPRHASASTVALWPGRSLCAARPENDPSVPSGPLVSGGVGEEPAQHGEEAAGFVAVREVTGGGKALEPDVLRRQGGGDVLGVGRGADGVVVAGDDQIGRAHV